MSIRITVDQSNWLDLPRAFPTDSAATPEDWIDGVLSGIRESWTGGLDAATEDAVREELRAGLASVRPEDSVTLQYWPWSRPMAAVVHVVFGEFEAGEDRPAYLLGDGALAAAPAFEVVTAQHLGEGIEVRMLARPEGFRLDVAGLTQLYASGDRFIAVGVDATAPELLTVMLGDLRDVLDTVAVLDDDGRGPWIRSEVADDAIPSQGEWWPVGASASPGA